jgi:NO-binding membrane sensor protein with MHYT domain
MTASRPASWQPVLSSLSIWFVHFIGCWAVSEFSPHRWWNHVMAWVFTIVALAAVGGLHWRLERTEASGDLARWKRRFARGATAIAVVAMLFTAWPSLVLLP